MKRYCVQGKVIYPRSAAELLLPTQSELEATVAPAPCIHPQAGGTQMLCSSSLGLNSCFRSGIATGKYGVLLFYLCPIHIFLPVD